MSNCMRNPLYLSVPGIVPPPGNAFPLPTPFSMYPNAESILGAHPEKTILPQSPTVSLLSFCFVK